MTPEELDAWIEEQVKRGRELGAESVQIWNRDGTVLLEVLPCSPQVETEKKEPE